MPEVDPDELDPSKGEYWLALVSQGDLGPPTEAPEERGVYDEWDGEGDPYLQWELRHESEERAEDWL